MTPGERYVQNFRTRNTAPNVRAPDAPVGAIRPELVFHVRVYADQTYRDGTPAWAFAVRRRFDTFATFVRQRFGARLEADAPMAWPYAVSRAEKLSETAAALGRQDRGDGVDWVIGFVGQDPDAWPHMASDERASKFIVVRPGVSGSDGTSANRVRNIVDAEVDKVLIARARHRELFFLAHAWAQSLGVPDERDEGFLGSRHYDLQAVEFSEASARLIALGLQYRGDWTPASRDAWATALRGEIQAHPTLYPADAAEEIPAWPK